MPAKKEKASKKNAARKSGQKTVAKVQANNSANATSMKPHYPELFQPMLTVIPLQLLAYHAAVLRGHDVDKPRNLAKSVTVE